MWRCGDVLALTTSCHWVKSFISADWLLVMTWNLKSFKSEFSPLFSPRNRAIADYLRSNGYEEAYSTFKKEAEIDMVRTDECTKTLTEHIHLYLGGILGLETALDHFLNGCLSSCS